VRFDQKAPEITLKQARTCMRGRVGMDDRDEQREAAVKRVKAKRDFRNHVVATQAQAVIAAAILRQLHAVITTGRKWDPILATHGTNHHPIPIAA